jgi:hypothetical protein
LRMKELSSGNSGQEVGMKIGDNRCGRSSVKETGDSEPG